jgi:hypothetical protein
MDIEYQKMVETAIKESPSYPTLKSLYHHFQKIRKTLFSKKDIKSILKDLEKANKIVFDGKRILWVSPDNPKLKQLLKDSVPF